MPERIIRPGILTSDAINLLSWPEEVFYRRLMSVVDDYGRFDGRNSVLRASLYPLKIDRVSDADVGKWKRACADAGLVSVYIVNEKEYLELLKFDQRMRGKPRWPEPTRGNSPPVAATRGDIPLSSEAEAETETHSETKTETYSPPAPQPSRKTHFVIPTAQEVVTEGVRIALPAEECAKFHDHHTARGWIPSGANRQLRDWRAALRNWHRNWRAGAFASKHVVTPATGDNNPFAGVAERNEK